MLCNPYEKQGKQNLCILFTFSRVCGLPFDDPKVRWRKGGGINVPISILKFSTRRAEALNVTVIVQDEFERIGYIVRKIFFIVIHLLYAVACVAVSNLLVFLHKSNPSSCLSAIVS